jgi:hypothetical protein
MALLTDEVEEQKLDSLLKHRLLSFGEEEGW